MKGDLKLKRELASVPPEKPSGDFSVAQIWVDASVYHLDSEFSYLVPANLNDSVKIGSLVSIPFNGREITGVVINRVRGTDLNSMKSITKVIGSIPLLAPEIIKVISLSANRFASHPFDLIRSAVPDRMATVEKDYVHTANPVKVVSKTETRQYLQLPPVSSRSELLAEKVIQLLKLGGTLVLLPDSREVIAMHRTLTKRNVPHAILDSTLPKSEYFRNFLDIRTSRQSLVIGTRSAVFAPVSDLQSIVVFNEGSEHFYERRSPGWNVRDIALLRSREEHVDLYFTGYSPSSEVARFIEQDWFALKRVKAKLKVATYQPISGELLPSRALAPIKSALAKGPVLFLVPLKGYAQAIRCAKCKTVSRCECGGAHEKLSETAPITCNHCLKSLKKWQCSWCHGEQPSLLSRGIARHQHEIGLLFPGTPTQISSSEHPLDIEVTSGIILATPGMAPSAVNGYAAVVILEGDRFLNQPDLRSQERVREMFFANVALARDEASILLIQDDGHSIATALSTWNPMLSVSNDLQERKSLGLPPFVRAISLSMQTEEIVKLKNALLSAQIEKRIPATTKILGPIPAGDKSALILTAEIADGDELVQTIHEFMRRRSAAKKALPTLRIDPYSLSH